MDASNKRTKTVSTIDVHMPAPKVERSAWLSEELDEHFHCVLCGGELEFRYRTNHIEGSVDEEAHCPRCRVRNRSEQHRLQ